MLRSFPRLASNQELPDYRVLNRLFEIVERLDNLRAIAPMFLQDSPTGKGIGVALPPSQMPLEVGTVYGTIPECTNSVLVQTTTAGGAVENVALDLRWPTSHPVANKNFAVGETLAFIRYQAGGATGLAVMPDIDGVVGRDGGDVITQRMDEFNIAELHGKDYAGADRKDFAVGANPAENCPNLTQYMMEWNGLGIELFDYSGPIGTQIPNGRRIQFFNQNIGGRPVPGTVIFSLTQADAAANKYMGQIAGKINTGTIDVVTGGSASAHCNDDGTISVNLVLTTTTITVPI